MLEWLMSEAEEVSNLLIFFLAYTCGCYWGEKISKVLGLRQ